MPLTEIEEPPVNVAVTVYVRVLSPPSDEGGEKLTSACLSPAAAVTFWGADGGPYGVTVMVPDGDPVPISFDAATVTEYGVPFVSPETVIGLPAPVLVIFVTPLSGVAVTVYDVMGLPPFDEGGEKDNVS